MTIKTFRGLMADDTQDTIVLHTNDGSTGYRIVKFEIMTNQPYAGATAEHVIKVYKTQQSTIDGVVDFSNQTLLGVAIINNHITGYQYPTIPTVIFDQEIFNQDIFITHKDMDAGVACNYYLELEQISLDLNASTATTLRSIRSNATGTIGPP